MFTLVCDLINLGSPKPHAAPAMPLLLLALSTTIVSVSAAGPMRGWMTWERYTCETDCAHFPETCISERLIRTMADAMQREGFVDAGYEYIQIDECAAATQQLGAPGLSDPLAVCLSAAAGRRASATHPAPSSLTRRGSLRG